MAKKISEPKPKPTPKVAPHKELPTRYVLPTGIYTAETAPKG